MRLVLRISIWMLSLESLAGCRMGEGWSKVGSLVAFESLSEGPKCPGVGPKVPKQRQKHTIGAKTLAMPQTDGTKKRRTQLNEHRRQKQEMQKGENMQPIHLTTPPGPELIPLPASRPKATSGEEDRRQVPQKGGDGRWAFCWSPCMREDDRR